MRSVVKLSVVTVMTTTTPINTKLLQLQLLRSGSVALSVVLQRRRDEVSLLLLLLLVSMARGVTQWRTRTGRVLVTDSVASEPMDALTLWPTVRWTLLLRAAEFIYPRIHERTRAHEHAPTLFDSVVVVVVVVLLQARTDIHLAKSPYSTLAHVYIAAVYHTVCSEIICW